MNIRTVVILIILINLLTVFNAAASNSDDSNLGARNPSMFSDSEDLIVTEVTNSKTMNEFGGISGSADNPPVNTQIDEELSEYYGVPVATDGEGLVYWHYVGRWYSQEEVMNLPSETIMYGASPYDYSPSRSTSSFGSSGPTNDVNKVPMPVTNYIVLAFLGVALLVSLKIKKPNEQNN